MSKEKQSPSNRVNDPTRRLSVFAGAIPANNTPATTPNPPDTQSLLAAAQRHAQEFGLLEHVRTALAREVDLKELYRTTVQAIADTFGYALVSLYLLEGDRLVLQNQVGYSKTIPEIPLNKGVLGRVVRTGKPVLLPDVRKDKEFLGVIENITSEVAVPFFVQGEVAGALNVESIRGVYLDETDLRLVTALSEHIGIAIRRARLYTRLRESETAYRNLASNLPGIVFRLHLNDETHMEFFNDVLLEMTGYKPAELTAGKFTALDPHVLEEDRDRYIETLKAAIDSQKPYQVEFRFCCKDGSQRWCNERGRPEYDSQGRMIFLDGVIFDITESKAIEESMAQYAQEMAALYETSLALTAHTGLPTLLQKIVENATALVHAPVGGLYLVQEEDEELELAVGYNLPEDIQGIRIKIGEGLSGRVAQSGEALIVEDYQQWEGQAPGFQKFQFHRIMGVPLKIKGRVIGVITVADTSRPGTFSEEDKKLVSLFAEQASVAIENARLYARLEDQATRDEMTGLYNRRGFGELGSREVERAVRFEHPLSALFIDIDHFKKLNDSYSHAFGDQVLRTVSRAIQSALREIDLVTRYGGDEFLALLVETDLKTAKLVGERVRKAVEQARTPLGQRQLWTTVSIGVATLGGENLNLDDLVHAADQAMYAAKEAGRNCVWVEGQTRSDYGYQPPLI